MLETVKAMLKNIYNFAIAAFNSENGKLQLPSWEHATERHMQSDF